jgi:pSer/pThr/pTyr-binding forkhead associated (FHA) protein
MENDYLIEDLGSRNGTFLERGYSVMQIMAATPLQSDDVIRISSVRLRFTQSAELPTSPRFPHPPAGAAADEVRISVEPVGSLLEPTVIRQDETVVRAGLPPPPPPPAVNHGGESEELRQAREEIAKLRREVADLSRELGELQTRLGQR